ERESHALQCLPGRLRLRIDQKASGVVRLNANRGDVRAQVEYRLGRWLANALVAFDHDVSGLNQRAGGSFIARRFASLGVAVIDVRRSVVVSFNELIEGGFDRFVAGLKAGD